jgi:valyl-tRNA synthetase
MDVYGTDALRFTLLVGSTPGNDMSLSLKKVEGNRNFANKIWNVGRFVISVINSQKVTVVFPTERTHADKMILARTYRLVRDVERLFQTYQYGEAGRHIYDFFWSEFADWYVEYAKNQIEKERSYTTAQVLAEVLDTSLRLLHPFMPFVTEELWGYLRRALLNSPLNDMAKDWPDAIIIAPWPEPRPEEEWEAKEIEDFAFIQENERSIRNVRAEKKVHPSKRIPAVFFAGVRTEYLRDHITASGTSSGLDESQLQFEYEVPSILTEDSIVLISGPIETHLPLAGMVDLDEERNRLQKELAESQIQIDRLEKLLGSDFANKAPVPVVQKEREKLAAFKETAGKLRAQLQGTH